MRRRRSFKWTWAARVSSVSPRPSATRATVFEEHGTITMPRVGREPLAIGAARSWSEYVRAVRLESASGPSPHSSRSTARAPSEITSATGTPAVLSASSTRTAIGAPLAPETPTTTGGSSATPLPVLKNPERLGR
jgi:hypothetical protein